MCIIKRWERCRTEKKPTQNTKKPQKQRYRSTYCFFSPVEALQNGFFSNSKHIRYWQGEKSKCHWRESTFSWRCATQFKNHACSCLNSQSSVTGLALSITGTLYSLVWKWQHETLNKAAPVQTLPACSELPQIPTWKVHLATGEMTALQMERPYHQHSPPRVDGDCKWPGGKRCFLLKCIIWPTGVR